MAAEPEVSTQLIAKYLLNYKPKRSSQPEEVFAKRHEARKGLPV